MRTLIQRLLPATVVLGITSAHAADPYEPNDSRDTATHISLSDTVRGSLEDYEDRDWFAVELPEGGDFFAEAFGRDDSFLLVDVHLYDAAGSYIGDYGAWIEESGTIYVELAAFDDGFSPPPGEYRLALSHFPAMDPSGGLEPLEDPEPLEPLPFDNPFAGDGGSEATEDRATVRAEAVPVSIGEKVAFELEGSTSDLWYRIDLPAAGLLLVSLDGENGADEPDLLPPLFIYDGLQAWDRNDGRDKDDNGVLWHAARIATGTAYIQLQPGWGWEAESGDFHFRTRFLPAATSIADAPPDCLATGQPGAIGALLTLTFPAGEETACYEVAVPSAGWLGPVGREATFDDYAERLWIEVGREVDGLPVRYGSGTTPLPPGTYQVLAWRQDIGERQQFHLDNAFVEPLPDRPVPLVASISLDGEDRSGGARIALDPGKKEARVTLSLERQGMLSGVVLGGPRAEFYVTEVGASYYDWERQLPVQLPPGDYEVIVAAEEDWSWPFDIQLALYPAVDSCEPNDGEDQACLLPLATPQRLRIASRWDVDWFALEIDRPGLLAIVLEGMPAPTFDEDGYQVSGFWPEIRFGWQAADGLFASNPALGIVGYLRAEEPDTYAFALSGEWLDGDPLTTLTVQAIQVSTDGTGDTAVFALGDAISPEERAELEFLAGLSNGAFAEKLDAEELIEAIRAYLEASP